MIIRRIGMIFNDKCSMGSLQITIISMIISKRSTDNTDIGSLDATVSDTTVIFFWICSKPKVTESKQTFLTPRKFWRYISVLAIITQIRRMFVQYDRQGHIEFSYTCFADFKAIGYVNFKNEIRTFFKYHLIKFCIKIILHVAYLSCFLAYDNCNQRWIVKRRRVGSIFHIFNIF